ncbi:carboxylate-amine ligase [Nigerium massiliense]|uniref:carboxylate-amine ligase n=1 Tax=Nigerium massiliense TaxID=1522317 RepID=UPI00058BC1CF|nr:glutamate--cysteine ligase [Nigerium massiliense]
MDRSVGIEEELLLVDPASGALVPAGGRALRRHVARTGDVEGSDVTKELFLPMIETGTDPCHTRAELLADLVRVRGLALRAAEEAGAALVASGTPVIERAGRRMTPDERYRRMEAEYGRIARDALTCGTHVHVEVGDDFDLAVAVLDRLRPWLPVLVALAANSPFWGGGDTGHASFRSQVWRRWPTAGQAEPYGDAAGYRAATQALLDAGAGLDPGMLYLDARLAAGLPTVEIRVADVCLDLRDTLTVAVLCRGLVDAAVADLHAGRPVPDVRSDLLHAAHWRAGRYGLGGELVHPVTGRLASARDVLGATLDRVRDHLAPGDADWLRSSLDRVLADGTGADAQRAAAASASGDLSAVVRVLAERTRVLSWPTEAPAAPSA